jgi:hypothetical protein
MSGYIASGRIAPGTTSLRHPLVESRRDPRAAPLDAGPAAPCWLEAAVESRPPSRLGVQWSAFRERWGQLTFYLFDPNSWR